MNKAMEENYLAKWLNGDLSKEELETFKKTPEYQSYAKIIEVTDKLEAPTFDVEERLSAVKSRISDTTADNSRVIKLNPYSRYFKVAAAAAIITLGIFLFKSSGNEKVSTEWAEHTEVVLPDQSEVFLNAGSSISYSDKKWTENRNIRLDGEAFFKVAKGESFTVETSSGTVTVLGTEFNVLQRGDIFTVSCYEGIVSVRYNGEEIKLPAGNGIAIIKGMVRNSQVEVNARPSWLSDESSFQSMPLQLVLGEFERQFNLEVETQNVDLQRIFTGTFSNTNMNLALQSISTPMNLKYSIEGNKVLLYAGDD